MTNHNDSILVNAPGFLDPTFGLEGIVYVPGPGRISGIVEDADGAMIYCVWADKDIWLYRSFADGTPDLEFGEGGRTRWSFAPGVSSMPVELLLQENGKIVLIGVTQALDDFEMQLAVTRFNQNGSPDLIFGNKIFLPPEEAVGTSNYPYGCLQKDGKILLGVTYADKDSVSSGRIYRLHSNGANDLEFGAERGWIDVQFNGSDTMVECVGVTKNDEILIGATSDSRQQLVGRFTSPGVIDPSFGINGWWVAEGVNILGNFVLHGEQIVVVGAEIDEGTYQACISRLTADGEFDPQFNKGKRLLVSVPVDTAQYPVTMEYVALQSDGKIVAAGHAGYVNQSFWLRVQNDGVLDPLFGDQGLHVHTPSSFHGGLLVQRNGQRIIAALDPASAVDSHILGIQS